MKIKKFTAIKKICDIYDWHGKGQIDLFYLGDVIYALGFNITKKICMANGQQEEEDKKFAGFDDVVNMVNAALKTPENHGNYHDYIELCKLYDKNENGTMMLAELENILSNLGKKTISILEQIYLFNTMKIGIIYNNSNSISFVADEIPKEDTIALLAELADPEDEDGFFPYTTFVDRLCGKA